MADSFYRNVPVFEDFNALTQSSRFQPMPSDWLVFVADIQGSFDLIADGRYQDVNTVGAACIAAAQSALPTQDFPFVFGGDGATLAVPASGSGPVAAALEGIRQLAEARFGITLRVGKIGVSELTADGFPVEVGKFRLAGKGSLAMFRGGGVAEAERRIKANPTRYAAAVTSPAGSDLSTLSCRWSPIASEKGIVVTLIVSSRTKAGSTIYERVLKELDAILGGNIASANPVHLSTMTYAGLGKILSAERRLDPGLFSRAFLRRCLNAFYAILMFRYNVRISDTDPRRYAASLAAHSDYRKFDDALRLVLDCTPAQAAAIRATLERFHASGEIWYGLHESKAALMTCLVSSMQEGEHIHFIDGDDGGYARASRQYKEQRHQPA